MGNPVVARWPVLGSVVLWLALHARQ